MSTDVLTNIALPKSSATMTVRIIKSFQYRTERSLVLHGVNLEKTSVGDLKNIARRGIVKFLRSCMRLYIEHCLQPFRLSQNGSLTGMYH
jgi:hypothetical protein